MKTAIISMIFGALVLPLAAQGPSSYYKLSLRGDCKVPAGESSYRSTRLSTEQLILALLAEAGTTADPRRCSIIAGVNPWSDLGDFQWYLYCSDRSNPWKYRIDRSALRLSRGDKSSSVSARRGSRSGTTTRMETSFVRFDFSTEFLDHFATLYTVTDMRANGPGPRVSREVETVEVKGGVQSYRLTGSGHHRTWVPDFGRSCPGKVGISLNGRVSNEDFENASHRGTIWGTNDPD